MTILAVASAAHLASGVLPAAGAYTNQTAAPVVQSQASICATVTYTRGASGGFPRFRPMWSDGTTEAQGTVLNTAIDLSSPPAGRQSAYLWEIDGPAPSGAGAVSFTLSFDVQPGATTFRLLAAEAGVTASPGTCAIALAGQKNT